MNSKAVIHCLILINKIYKWKLKKKEINPNPKVLMVSKSVHVTWMWTKKIKAKSVEIEWMKQYSGKELSYTKLTFQNCFRRNTTNFKYKLYLWFHKSDVLRLLSLECAKAALLQLQRCFQTPKGTSGLDIPGYKLLLDFWSCLTPLTRSSGFRNAPTITMQTITTPLLWSLLLDLSSLQHLLCTGPWPRCFI